MFPCVDLVKIYCAIESEFLALFGSFLTGVHIWLYWSLAVHDVMYVYVTCLHIPILERKISLKTLGNGASSGRREEGEDKVAMHINN